MSPEDARALLDSAKSDEHHSLAVPAGPRDPNQPGRIGCRNSSAVLPSMNNTGL